jgi:uroporphyrinogen-III decarboxylase
MNHYDRAVAAMRGDPVDRIPFIGRMDLWYSFHRNRGTLPEPFEKAALWDIQRELDIGIFSFGAWKNKFYQLVPKKIQVSIKKSGNETLTIYETPYGSLRCRDVMAEELCGAAGTAARVEYPFKDSKDYDALRFLFEQTAVEENLDLYANLIEAIGTDGIALPYTGHLPAHQLMIFWMGYEAFYHEMYDHPDQLQSLIEALTEQYHLVLDLAVQCPVDAIEVGANYDEQMTPPPIFEQFFAPIYREVRTKLHSHNKILVVHGDGEMDKLLVSLMDCGVEVVEAVTPKPMTSIDIGETRQLWSDKVTMWGGVASVILTESFSETAFEHYLDDLFQDIAPGDRFILGFGDNVPTDALFERIHRVAEFWREKGGYPIDV